MPFCVDPAIHTLSYASVLSMSCLEGSFFLQDKKVIDLSLLQVLANNINAISEQPL